MFGSSGANLGRKRRGKFQWRQLVRLDFEHVRFNDRFEYRGRGRHRGFGRLDHDARANGGSG